MAGFFVFLPVFLACQSLFQTAWYYAGGRLGRLSDALSFLVAAAVTLIIARRNLPWSLLRQEGKREPSSFAPIFFVLIPALAAFGFVIWGAIHAATADSIRTPWPLMPHGTLAAVALLFLCTLVAAWKSRSTALTGWLSALTILAVTLIAPLLYKLGFGFDGFLHRASELIIQNTGTLSPPPPYYIGQYVFVTWISRLFSIPLKWVEILLVPLAAGTLPFFFWLAFPRAARPWRLAALSLFLPLGLFIATTPQSFAYVLGLIAICLTINPHHLFAHSDDNSLQLPLKLRGSVWAGILLTLWSVAVHPLAGLPFLGIVFLILSVNKQIPNEPPRGDASDNSLQLPLNLRGSARGFLAKILILIFTVISIPLAFWLNSLRSSASVTWNFSPLLHLSTYTDLFAALLPPANHLSLWADWAALVQFLFPLILVLLTFRAIASNLKRRRLWIWMSLAAVGLALSGLLLGATGQFSFLIDYERGNYADRLFLLAQLILLFPALDGFAGLINRLNGKTKFNLAVLVVILCAWQAAQAYLALPRHDATIVGHGWSVGQADQQAVAWIEQDAKNKPYTVLANQSVSAAAVEAYGFKRYVGDVFYYPIPTGGPLYQIYLQAAQNPSRDLIKQASILGQSDRVYFVLNDYWWDAEKTADRMQNIADQSVTLENGRVKIYKFDFTSSTSR